MDKLIAKVTTKVGAVTKKRKGDINYVVGILVVASIMLLILAGAKTSTVTDIVTKVVTFFSSTIEKITTAF